MKMVNVLLIISSILAVNAKVFAGPAQLSPTVYFIKTMDLEQKCSTKKTIYAVNGKPLFKVCKESYNKCVIEGTCAIIENDEHDDQVEQAGHDHTQVDQLDFDIINYVKMDKNGLPLFTQVDMDICPYGYGVSNICLDPFYSVAADLKFHKAGDVIFVNKVQGLKLPNGETHSGFFIVRDKGGAIKGAHRFDFFSGLLDYKDPRNPFTPEGLASSNNKLEYRKATSEEAADFKKMRQFPKIPQSMTVKD